MGKHMVFGECCGVSAVTSRAIGSSVVPPGPVVKRPEQAAAVAQASGMHARSCGDQLSVPVY